MNKTALIDTLSRWIHQRPGLEPANYISGWNDTDGRRAYRAEVRSITKDLHQARALLRYVSTRDSITAEQILEACRHSFSGRLTITPEGDSFKVDYCTGQYWPTEYRRAVCSVLSSAIWEWLRASMPRADGHKLIEINGKMLEIETHRGMTPGDYLRNAAKHELGRPIASRWFN